MTWHHRLSPPTWEEQHMPQSATSPQHLSDVIPSDTFDTFDFVTRKKKETERQRERQ
jgi:hypothetical protein